MTDSTPLMAMSGQSQLQALQDLRGLEELLAGSDIPAVDVTPSSSSAPKDTVNEAPKDPEAGDVSVKTLQLDVSEIDLP